MVIPTNPYPVARENPFIIGAEKPQEPFQLAAWGSFQQETSCQVEKKTAKSSRMNGISTSISIESI